MTRHDVMPWKVTCIAYITRRFNHASSIIYLHTKLKNKKASNVSRSGTIIIYVLKSFKKRKKLSPN